ncbi:MAG: hypothetical protein HY817_00195 [Candidatus Abawacabacteria bacterium]|nr:hypothetical protein [Candidatus Abawacabacteria bacterium]
MAQTVHTTSGDSSANVLLGVLLAVVIIGLLIAAIYAFGGRANPNTSGNRISGQVDLSLPSVPGVAR